MLFPTFSFIATLIVAILLPAVALFVFTTKLARRRFCSRQPMSDETFLRRVNATPESACLVLLLRKAIADQCGLSPEMVWDTDECDVLANRLTWTGGWDTCEFLALLERELRVTIGDDVGMKIPSPGGWKTTLFGKRGGCVTVAGWIRAAVPYIHKHTTVPCRERTT